MPMYLDEWRLLLYYPLGLLPSLFFTLRFLIQWIRSEQQQKSYVDALFWKLSIAGNLLLLGHYFLQGQYPFALIQTGNAVISWRNLNLIQAKKPAAFASVLALFALSFLSVSLCFALEARLIGEIDWMRAPQSSKAPPVNPGILWHAIGILGQGLFASRFWVQWWGSEKQKKSELGRAFWWLSLMGSAISVVYFLQIRDVISILNQSFGMIPYVRNLMLLRKARLQHDQSPIDTPAASTGDASGRS
ncbi:MAG: lipid-A-disaccharide synthase N-terminal domain-containing protein [Parachlamydia sp.]|nr:lipid-A-disaccharide synthase N-terminal domain-containing protein [Parachlamydia sp.]